MPDAASNPSPKSRRWTIVAAGLLVLALALVVMYTSRAAFLSPLALVVVAAIGIAALLLQLRFRKYDAGTPSGETEVRAPLWINVLGLVFALGAVFADFRRGSAQLMLMAALGSVVCFAVSGVTVLRGLRKKKAQERLQPPSSRPLE